MGFNIIPLVQFTKEAAIPWKEFQTRRCTDSELKTWFLEQEFNIGIICGEVVIDSQKLYFATVDFDNPEYIQALFPNIHELKQETVVVRTNRGIHAWFLSKKSVPTFKIPPLELDVKGEKSYAIAPPSLHPSGKVYEIVGQPDKIKIVDDLEEFIKKKVEAKGVFRDLDKTNVYLDPGYGMNHIAETNMPECALNLSQGVKEGMRDDAAMIYASILHFYRKLDPKQLKEVMYTWNKMNKPPLDKAQLDKCIKSGMNFAFQCSGIQKRGLCVQEMENRCPMERRLITIKPVQVPDSKTEDTKTDIVLKTIESRIERKLLREDPIFYITKLLKKAINFVSISPLYTHTVEEITRDVTFNEQFFSESKIDYMVYVCHTHSRSKPLFMVDRISLVQPSVSTAYYIKPMFATKNDVLEYLKKADIPEKKEIIGVLRRNGIEDDKDITNYLLNYMVEVAPRFSNFEYLDDIDWNKFLNELISYKAKKDSRLYTAYKATLLRGIEMRFSPHAFIATNAEAGKSTFYKFAGMKLDDVRPNSLIGYSRGKDEVYTGALNNQIYPVCIDQIESETSKEILNRLFSFMEDGELLWSKGGVELRVTGKCTVVIAANPLGYTSDSTVASFRQIIDVMSSNNVGMGRRFGILIYGMDYKRVEITDKSFDEKAWRELFEVFRSIETVALPKLKQIFADPNIRNWLENPMEDYTSKILQHIDVIKQKDEEVGNFLEAHATSAYRHIRAAALNCALADYMPLIVKDIISCDSILESAEKYLKNITEINLESIANLSGTVESLSEIAKMTFRHTYGKQLQSLILAIQGYKKAMQAVPKSEIVVSLNEIESYLQNVTVEELEKEIKQINMDRLSYYNITLKKYFGISIRKADTITVIIDDWEKPGVELSLK